MSPLVVMTTPSARGARDAMRCATARSESGGTATTTAVTCSDDTGTRCVTTTSPGSMRGRMLPVRIGVAW